jgi:parvulin-like peptidyl-prolyl isomerase
MLDTLRTDVLQQIIDEKLIVAEAKKQGVTVSDAEVKRQVEAEIAQKKQELGGEAAFLAQMKKENLTEEKLREKYANELRRQLLAYRLVHKQFPDKKPSAVEAEAYFKTNRDKFPKAPAQIRTSVIQIPVAPDSATDVAAKAKAMSVRKRIVGGEKFAKVAAEVSDDEGSARSGGDLGFFTRGQMEPAFEEASFTQRIGQVGQPVRSNVGWHIIEVLERDTLKTHARRDSLDERGRPMVEAHVRHILVRVAFNEADVDRAKTLAEKVHALAVAPGADFAALAKRYSKYQGPHGDDGDVGFLPMSTLQANIRAGLDSVKVGSVSEVLVNPAGFNIFRVTEKKAEREYELAEIKDELPDAVQQIQFKEKYEAWVKTLRAKAVIEVRKS